MEGAAPLIGGGMEILRADALPESVRDIDFSFDIDAIVVEPFGSLPLRIEPSPFRRKSYDLDDGLFWSHDGVDEILFVARENDGAVAGYITVTRHWNGCAVVDDFAVARPFRRRGLASALMDQAVGWARKSDLGTIRLETQSTNVAACRFYEKYGFILGGYDRFLYRELGPEISEEVALFWYLNISSRDGAQ